MNVGDIVIYTKWNLGERYWYLQSIRNGRLCTIVAIRDGKYTHTKNGEEVLNANIVNVDINDLVKV